MRVLDLFSGIGGFSLGLERAGMKTVAFCEIEKYPQQVLRKNFQGVPIYEDVRQLTAERLAADGIDNIDLICGGFPCQPFSVAGKRRGKEDNRFLWPEMYRIIQEVRPNWGIGENVAGLIDMELDQVYSDLEAIGYEVQPFIIPACAVDALHRRDRVWIIFNSIHCTDCTESSETCQKNRISSISREKVRSGVFGGAGSYDANSYCQRLEGRQKERGNGIVRPESVYQFINGLHSRFGYDYARGYAEWEPEPDVGRVAHGIPNRVDRLKGLGNAVVPQIPEIIGRAIMQVEREVPR